MGLKSNKKSEQRKTNTTNIETKDTFLVNKETFDLVSDYVIILSKEANVLWFNKSFKSCFDTNNKNSFHEFLFPNDYEYFNTLLKSGDSFECRIKQIMYPVWVSWQKKSIIDKGIQCYLLIGKNSTLIKQSEVYFNELAQVAAFGYCEYSLSDKIIHLNPSICNILGFNYSIKHIHIEDYIKMIHPVDNLKFINWFNQSSQVNEIQSIEYRIIDNNDKIKYLKTHVKNIQDSSCEISRRSVFIHDISQLKNIINHLKFSESKFRGIFNNSPIGIVSIGTTGEILDINQAGLDILGSPSKVETLKINVLHFTLLQEIGVAAKVKESITKGKSSTFKSRYRSKWGKEVFLKFMISPIKDDYDKINGVLLLAEDLTVQKDVQQELSKSEKRYLQTLQLIPDTIIVYDFDYNVIDFHKSANKNTVLFRKDIQNENLKDTLSPDVFNLIKSKTNWVKSNDTPIDFKFKLTIKGKQLQFESRLVKLDSSRLIAIIKEITAEKETVMKLAEHEQRLSEASEIAKIGWYEVIGTEGYYYGSGETHNIFFDKDIGNPINKDDLLNTIHPDDAQRFFDTVKLNIENRSKYFTWEYRLITPNKKLKYVWTKTYLSFDENGNLTGRFGVVQDITDIKTTQLELEKSENRLIEAQRMSKIGWYEMNMHDKSYTASAETMNIYFDSIDKTESTFEELLVVVHPKDRELFMNIIQESVEKKQRNYSFVHRVISPNNKLKYVLVKANVVCDELENIIRRHGIVQDITVQTEAERALKESEARFKGVFMNSPIGIIIFNKEGEYMLCNKSITKIFNVNNDNYLKGFNLYDDPNIPENNKEDLRNKEATSFETLANYSFLSIKNAKKCNNTLGYFEYRIAPIGTELKSTGYIALISDITKRKQMESEIIDAKDKAEDADQLKSAFLANMSHEIRTPLNAILGFSSLLEINDYSKAEYSDFIRTINANGQHLLNIINDIIDFSKIEANQLILSYDEVNINSTLSEIHMLMKNLVPEGVDFIYKTGLDDSEATILTDNQRITQIFINLINNAFKFTYQGYVGFGYTLNRTKGNLVFHVKDTGCGIEADKLPEIFKRFHQLDHIKQGAGLGLSISRGLIALMGGEIWLESEINKGTTFYFSIPYKKSPN